MSACVQAGRQERLEPASQTDGSQLDLRGMLQRWRSVLGRQENLERLTLTVPVYSRAPVLRHIKAKTRPQHHDWADRQPFTRARLCTVNVTSGIMTRTSRPQRTGRTLKSTLLRLTALCALGHDSTAVCCQHAMNCRVKIVFFLPDFFFFFHLPLCNIFHTHGQGARKHMQLCGVVRVLQHGGDSATVTSGQRFVKWYLWNHLPFCKGSRL